MSFRRESLLSNADEVLLAEKMLPLWNSGEKGREIAKKLGFGREATPLAQLRPEYIFFFRQKFNKGQYVNKKGENKNSHLKPFKDKFPVRKKPSFGQGEKRYNTAPEDLKLLTVKEFLKLTEENPNLNNDSAYSRRVKSFLALLFFTPLRSSEIYERVIGDFVISKDRLTIKLLRKKKRHKSTDKLEPVSIPLVFPLMSEVVEWLEGEEWKDEDNPDKPFNISSATARNYVREIVPNGYPHWTRFRFLTLGASDPRTSIAELKAKSRLTLSALEHYLMATEKLEADFDARQVQRLRDEGVIP